MMRQCSVAISSVFFRVVEPKVQAQGTSINDNKYTQFLDYIYVNTETSRFPDTMPCIFAYYNFTRICFSAITCLNSIQANIVMI